MIRKIIPPRLVNNQMDLNSAWYIIYQVFDVKAGRFRRFRFSKGFSKFKTVDERMDYAMKQLQYWNDRLRDPAFDPFACNRVIVSDQLAYQRSPHKSRTAGYDIRHYLNQYFASQRKYLRKKSFATYQSRARIFSKWLVDEKLNRDHPKFFTFESAESFLKHIHSTRKIEPRTVNSYTQTMFTIWEWFCSREICEVNPWKKIRRLKYHSRSKRPFSPQQTEAIRKRLLAEDPWLWFFCEFQYYTLVRPCSEQQHLIADDIDWFAQTLKVRSEIAKNHKTQNVALPNHLIDRLREWDLMNIPKHWYIFGKTGPSERPAPRDYFSKQLRKHLTALGIGREWSMYSWKHTMNQRAALRGVPLKEMQMQNRHHSLDQMDQYMKSLTVVDGKNLYDNLPEI